MSDPAQRDHVCQRLEEYVVKAVGESGGYGMLIGPHSTEQERSEFREKINAQPRNYIAQPTINLSTAPCFVDGAIEPRHVDLRPYVLYGEKITIVPGGHSSGSAKGITGGQFVSRRRLEKHVGLAELRF